MDASARRQPASSPRVNSPPDAVETALAAAFAPAQLEAARSTVAEYGTRAFDRECERVRLAAIQLAGGDLDKLRRMIDAAKVDYRDVLMWASQPPRSADEAAADLAKAKEILKRWGRG